MASAVRRMRVRLLLRLHEGVGNLFTAIGRRDEYNDSTTSNDQTKRTSILVALIIYLQAVRVK